MKLSLLDEVEVEVLQEGLVGATMIGMDNDEDITPSDVLADPPTVMHGPMTRARMRQLNLEVSSFTSFLRVSFSTISEASQLKPSLLDELEVGVLQEGLAGATMIGL